MSDCTAGSQEASPQSDDVTEVDSMSQRQASLLTNASPSGGVESSSLTSGSIATKTSLHPCEKLCEPVGSLDHNAVGPGSQDCADAVHVLTDGSASLEERQEAKTTRSSCVAAPAAKGEETQLSPQKPLKSQVSFKMLKRTSTPTLLFFLATCPLATVIIYVQATYAAEERSRGGRPLSDLLKTDVSRTLTILRASQGILSALVSLALEKVFFLLQWSQLQPPNGISYLNVLALSPTTGAFGTLGLIKSSAARAPAKIWALSRVVLTALVWASGLALFFNTSFITVYDTAHTYSVTAGVGPFNASLLQPFREFLHSLSPAYPYETLPYTYFAAAYTLVINPLVSVVTETRGCSDNLCMSYILSGGLEMVVPWVPQVYPDHSMVMVKRVPSIRVDFTGPVMDTFDDSDCDVFGESGVAIGIRLCLAPVQSSPESLRAGMFVCQGIDNGTCNGQHPAPNMTTQVSFHTLQVSLVAARSNHSIVSIMDTTSPIPVLDLDLAAYRDSLRWLLNYTAADLPPPSSIAQSFWSSKKQLQDPATWGFLFQNFQSILVFPFWLFNANNWGNPESHANKTVASLPPEFFTEASIVEPYEKFKVHTAVFILFLVFQILSLLFVGVIVGWTWIRCSVPLKTSSFPLFDIAFRAKVQSDVEDKDLDDLNDSEIVHLMKDAKAVGRFSSLN